jgi:5'-methylthioadenosine phosphorylase
MAKSQKAKGERAQGKGALADIGIIGGSGLYAMSGLTDWRELRVKTPFGDPSDVFVVGTLEGKRVVFLARHGRGHRLLPSELNFRANIYAMKLLGVQRIVSVSAVGSLQENLRPGEFLVPDQFFDRTKGRISTFFGNGLVAHVGFDKPTCGQLDRSRRCVRLDRRAHSSERHLYLHGRSAILHAGRGAFSSGHEV